MQDGVRGGIAAAGEIERITISRVHRDPGVAAANDAVPGVTDPVRPRIDGDGLAAFVNHRPGAAGGVLDVELPAAGQVPVDR